MLFPTCLDQRGFLCSKEVVYHQENLPLQRKFDRRSFHSYRTAPMLHLQSGYYSNPTIALALQFLQCLAKSTLNEHSRLHAHDLRMRAELTARGAFHLLAG